MKYFNNEAHEVKRYDETLAQYETASIKTQTSLALLKSVILLYWLCMFSSIPRRFV